MVTSAVASSALTSAVASSALTSAVASSAEISSAETNPVTNAVIIAVMSAVQLDSGSS